MPPCASPSPAGRAGAAERPLTFGAPEPGSGGAILEPGAAARGERGAGSGDGSGAAERGVAALTSADTGAVQRGTSALIPQ